MLRFICILVSIFCFFYTNKIYALQSNWGGINEAEVRIISPISKTNNNYNIYLGLEYKLKKDWKTYWHSPGDGGFPQTLSWENSTNVSYIEILWPQPKQFEILGIKSIGYENEIVFPLKIKLEDVSKPTFFLFDLNYLTCKDICVPGKAHLELTLPAGQGELTEHSFKIEKYLSKTPYQNNDIAGLKVIDVKASKDGKISLIKIEAQSKFPLKEPNFFLGNDIGLPVINPQYKFSTDRRNVTATFYYSQDIFNYESFDLSILFSDQNVSVQYKTKIKPNIVKRIYDSSNYSYLYIFLISIIGGLILNCMPCVLPVLSLKLLSILNHRQENLYVIRKSFFITAVGIIVSFLLVASILILIKLGGASINWGMQFQQPLYLMFIALILFLFSINLIGFIEFNLPTFINRSFLIFNKKSLFTDFFNGFFATLLATPCSAPFVGTAISVAFTQSYFVMLGIFFFMGLGMAIPYIVTGIFPKIIYFLPKPGKWMNIIKYLLACLLMITLVWIGTILKSHFNYFFITISFILISIILMSTKYFINYLKYTIIIISIIIFFSLNFISQLKIEKFNNNKDWIDLTKINIDKILSKNIIFVDITADWCATCQFNKFNVLNSRLIKKTFIENDVIKIRGDWTKSNKQIEKYLNDFNRFGIPFNAIYSINYPNGIVLSEILTSSEIIDTINLIKKDNK